MKVKVKVPATSANLGPGFDVAGLALTLYNTFTFELNEGGLNITGCPTQFCNEENLTYQAFSQAAQSCGLDFKGVNIHCEVKFLIQEVLEVVQHVLSQESLELLLLKTKQMIVKKFLNLRQRLKDIQTTLHQLFLVV